MSSITNHGTGGYQSNVSYNCSNFNLQDMVEDNYQPVSDGDAGPISPVTQNVLEQRAVVKVVPVVPVVNLHNILLTT